MAVNIAAMTAMAKKIVNGNTGYNQARRWAFYDRRNDTFVPNQDTDCSAMCGAIARAGTKKVQLGTEHGDFWTGNFESKLVGTGEFKGMAYPGNSAVKEGDFLWKPGHVVYAVSPTMVAEAYIGENGRITGGRPGNQNGMETRIRQNWGGWTRLIRPITTTTTKPPTTGGTTTTTALPIGEHEMLHIYKTENGKRLYAIAGSRFWLEFTSANPIFTKQVGAPQAVSAAFWNHVKKAAKEGANK